MSQYSASSKECPEFLCQHNPSRLNADGEVLYIYPCYTEFRPMVKPRKGEDVCPVLSDTRRNHARVEAIEFEYQSNELIDGQENDQASIDAFNRVEERLYICQPQHVGGENLSKRGVITHVSAKSARRLQKKMARAALDLWIDLTFADDVLSHLPFSDRMRVSYACVNEFERYLKSLGLFYIWKKEIETRKSGVYVGSRVPHYHFCLGGLSQAQKDNWRQLSIKLLTKWVKITGSSDPNALVVALKIKSGVPQSYRLIENHKMAIRYVGKYFSKTSVVQGRSESSGGESIGRAWGCSRDLPLASAQIVHLDPAEACSIRRLVRRYLKPKKNKRFIGLLEQLRAGYSTFAFIAGDVMQSFTGLCAASPGVPRDVVPF